MKKIFKSMLLMLAVSTGFVLTSCSDDDNLTTADALFRPVLTENNNIEHGLDENLAPYMIVTWDNFTDATQYVVSAVANDGSDSQTITTDTTTCTFSNLQYDKEYNVSIRCENTATGLVSKDFTLTTTTLDYPTKLASLGSSDIIDNAARISWSDIAFDRLEIYKDNDDELVETIELTDADNEAGTIIVTNLEPKTTYRVLAYVNDQYLGKKKFTTSAAEDFGDDAVIDLRGLTANESKKYINSAVIAADIEANPGKDITYVLQGGVQYTISDVKFPTCPNRIKFVTGLTLAGNAEFVSSSAMTALNGSEIEALEFEKINFYAGKGNEDVKKNTAKGFSSKQVFNCDKGISSPITINSISFKSCNISNYRAVVRSQENSNTAFINVSFEDCVINGVGDQGVITTSNKAGNSFSNISFNNCTLLNIYLMSDLRTNNNKEVKFDITNCTFCYAPSEGSQLCNHGSTAVTMNVQKSLFGPAMLKDAKTYQVGSTGKLLNASKTSVSTENSYYTTFEWNAVNLFDGIKELKMTEAELWKAPAEGDFTIIGKLDESGIGDARWQ